MRSPRNNDPPSFHSVDRTGTSTGIVYATETAARILGYPSFHDITTQQQAETAYNQLAALVESANDAIIGMDLDGTVTSWNAAAEELYGYRAPDILGRSAFVLMPPEQQDEIEWVRQRLHQGERIVPFETIRLRRDGQRLDVWVAISPIKNEDGRVVGVSSIVRDATARKLADEAQQRHRQRLRALLRHSVDVVSESDALGHVTYVSPSVERVLGYTADDYLSLQPLTLIHPNDRAEIERTFADLVTQPGATTRWQARHRHKDGSWRWLEGTVTNLLDDANLGAIVWNYRDVTEQKRGEEEIRRAQVVLEQRVKERTTELSAANELLKAQLAERQRARRLQARRTATLHTQSQSFAADTTITRQLQWTAMSFLILALGILVVRNLHPLLDATPDANTAMYASVAVWIVASGLLAFGLLPATPRFLSGRAVIGLILLLGVVSSLVIVVADSLPRLTYVDPNQTGIKSAGVTSWHWALSSLPLAVALAAAIGLLRQSRREPAGRWLVASLVFWSAAQLYDVLWPAVYAYPPYPADVLRLISAAAVVAAVVVDSCHLAERRATLLAAERAYSKRLGELNVFKADFTAIVAHELSSPIAAIGRLAAVLNTGEVPPTEHHQLLHTIESETELLEALVDDVRTAARAERDDFTVRLQPVPVTKLVEDAAAAASALPGDHPVTTTIAATNRVLVDPERMAQVLQNLLGNAAKFSPAGSPVELRAIPDGGRVRFEVADHGPGIHPDDLCHIFEKFGRGRHATGQQIAGTGVGLYLARRIVCAHGAELTVTSRPGGGSLFAFSLESAP